MIQRDFELLLEQAIQEDLQQDGDVTSNSIFTNEVGQAVIIAKQTAIVSGISWVLRVFQRLDKDLELQPQKKNGDTVVPGEKILIISGKMVSILQAERIALNFLGYLSGIATQTRRLQDILDSVGTTVLLDTRKTLPGYRFLAKEAVVHGGGANHRMGLYDLVMIKDNHIDAAGGITQAVNKVRKAHGSFYDVEVECRTFEDVQEALTLPINTIMLDNMSVEDCKKALDYRDSIGSTILFEASGDMDEEKVSLYGGIGLNFISSGKMTHSVKNVDFSLQYVK